ncbi:MAG: glycosyltransferase 87 family protein, partial [Anaerolineae bacterium]|nr:glycosyltransferase 87 family protein [Anaerolineae bacterium]
MLNEWQTLTPARRGLLLGLAALLLLATLHFILSTAYLPFDVRQSSTWAWDFRNNLWGPAHLLLAGESPYRIDRLYDANSVWLPMVIGTFFAAGALPLPVAANLWLVLCLGALAGVLLLSMRQAQPAPLWLALCLGAVLLFPPLVSHVLLGQYSLVAVLLCLLAAEGLRRGLALPWLALLLALAAGKPQLVLLVLPGLLAALHQRGGGRSAGYFALWLALWCALLTLPLWLAFPGWLEGFLWAQGRNAVWLQPSLLFWLRAMAGTAGSLLWALLALAALAVTVRRWRRIPPDAAMRQTLALTVIITPYVWSWDFVLLLPLLIRALFGVQTRAARLVWAAGYAALWLALLAVRLAAQT